MGFSCFEFNWTSLKHNKNTAQSAREWPSVMSHKPPRTGSHNKNLQFNFCTLQPWKVTQPQGHGEQDLVPAAPVRNKNPPAWSTEVPHRESRLVQAWVRKYETFFGQNCVTAQGEACSRPRFYPEAFLLQLCHCHNRTNTLKIVIFSWSFLRKLPHLCSILPAAALSVPACIMVWWWEAALKTSQKPNRTTRKNLPNQKKNHKAAQQPWKPLIMLQNQINRYRIAAFPSKNRNKDAKLGKPRRAKPAQTPVSVRQGTGQPSLLHLSSIYHKKMLNTKLLCPSKF